jgi:hypothetical protein
VAQVSKNQLHFYEFFITWCSGSPHYYCSYFIKIWLFLQVKNKTYPDCKCPRVYYSSSHYGTEHLQLTGHLSLWLSLPAPEVSNPTYYHPSLPPPSMESGTYLCTYIRTKSFLQRKRSTPSRVPPSRIISFDSNISANTNPRPHVQRPLKQHFAKGKKSRDASSTLSTVSYFSYDTL